MSSVVFHKKHDFLRASPDGINIKHIILDSVEVEIKNPISREITEYLKRILDTNAITNGSLDLDECDFLET